MSSTIGATAPSAHQTSVRRFFGGAAAMETNAIATASAPVPSSFAYSGAPSSASSSLASSPARLSESRGRKRDRHSDEEEGDATTSGVSDGATSASAAAVTPSKLAARTLLYQLHVLREDETLLLAGVDGGAAGVEMAVRTLEHEAASERLAEAQAAAAAAEAEARAHDATTQPSRDVLAADSSCMDDDEEHKCDATSSGRRESEEEEAPAAALAGPTMRPLFPESLDFVRLYLSAEAAHAAFLRARSEWRARGVRRLKERIMELQLTQPLQLLVIASETQRRQWLPAADAMPMEDDDSCLAAAPSVAVRASPFSKPLPQPRVAASIPASAPTATCSSSSTSSIHLTSLNSAAAPAATSLPALYAAPSLSTPLRRLLSSHEDSLDGFCVHNSVVSEGLSSAGLDLHPTSVLHSEVVVRGSVCASRLHVIDDDKKARVNQQLLTDLFGRMNVERRTTPRTTSTTASAANSSSGGLYLAPSPACASSSACSSPAASSYASAGNQSWLRLSPSSFSPEMQAFAPSELQAAAQQPIPADALMDM